MSGLTQGSLFTGIGGRGKVPHMPRGAPPKQYPGDLVEKVAGLYAQNQTQAEIASALGLSQKIIWNLMRRHGLERRPSTPRDQAGPRNANWKGSSAGYQALHIRVQVERGKPQHCEDCGLSGPVHQYDWANLTGRYDDPTDYKRLCRSCHFKLDGQQRNLGAYAVRQESPIS